VLEIAGHIDDRSARRVEDLLWELVPEASHLREHVGAFADRTNQQVKSYPLALTQLLIAYHMVKAAMGVHAV
jgi:phosphoribulokinase